MAGMGKIIVDVVDDAVAKLEHIDVNIGNGHLMHHGVKNRWTSIVKTFTWRIIASTTTAAIALVITGSLEVAGVVGVIDMAIKLVFYYWHERLWIHLGKRRNRTVE